MMLGAPAGSTIEIRPADGSGRVYFARKPAVIDRVRLRAEMARVEARSWGMLDILTGMGIAAREVLADDQAGLDAAMVLIQDRLTVISDLLEEVRAERMAAWSDEFAAAWADACALPPALTDLADELARRHERFGRIVADNAAFPLARGLAYARVLLTGWDGVPAAMQRQAGLVSEASLALIPDGHLIEIGAAIEAALTPSRHEKKASPLPSGGPSEAAASTDSSAAPS